MTETVCEAPQVCNSAVAVEPRKAISWDEYFISVAHLSSMRCQFTEFKAGACVVNEKNRIVGMGYAGLPVGVTSECVSRGVPLGATVVHSVMNALLNLNQESAAGCRLYCTKFPCSDCAKVIVQAGISAVVCASRPAATQMKTPDYAAAIKLLSLARVKVDIFENSERLKRAISKLHGELLLSMARRTPFPAASNPSSITKALASVMTILQDPKGKPVRLAFKRSKLASEPRTTEADQSSGTAVKPDQSTEPVDDFGCLIRVKSGRKKLRIVSDGSSCDRASQALSKVLERTLVIRKNSSK